LKIHATFEQGALHLHLTPETEAEQRMIGACIDQPQAESGCAYMDKGLISASLHYEGHWSNKRIRSVVMSIYKPNESSPTPNTSEAQ
jgi:hypothetical protein